MVSKKLIHVNGYVRRMPKKTTAQSEEKKLKAEYKLRVRFGTHRNLPYEEWKKWYLSE
jgi:hypothetical protein